MTLTEQWKIGELKTGMYYIKYKGSGKLDWWHGYYWEDSWSENVEEVLAPVPTYEEWKQACDEYRDMQEQVFSQDSIYSENERLIDELDKIEEENQQLKELLKECREVLLSYSNISGDYKLYDKIDNAIGEKK